MEFLLEFGDARNRLTKYVGLAAETLIFLKDGMPAFAISITTARVRVSHGRLKFEAIALRLRYIRRMIFRLYPIGGGSAGRLSVVYGQDVRPASEVL